MGSDDAAVRQTSPLLVAVGIQQVAVCVNVDAALPQAWAQKDLDLESKWVGAPFCVVYIVISNFHGLGVGEASMCVPW